MHLTVSNNVLIYRQFSNRDVKLPISNMTEKIYDHDAKTVRITTTINNLPRIFYFQFSEITRPEFATFNAMVLWFDENVKIPVQGGSTPVSTGNIRLSETFYAPSYISYLAFAPAGSLETDAVWTITKRVGSADGTIISNVQYSLKKWTERGLL